MNAVKISSKVKRRITILIVVVLALLWSTLYLPGRVPWLHYSFPIASTHLSNGMVVVPIPDEASDGTMWSLDTVLGSNPNMDKSRLHVKRLLSSTIIDIGEDITVKGQKYTYLKVSRLDNSKWGAYLRKQ